VRSAGRLWFRCKQSQDNGVTSYEDKESSSPPVLNTYRTRTGKIATRVYRHRHGGPISKYHDEYQLLRQDRAAKIYFADLSTPEKPLNPNRQTKVLQALILLLKRLERPTTTTAISELIEQKRKHPEDTTIETELKLWKAEARTSTILNHIAIILGVFRRNYATLQMSVHVSSDHQTIPIAEPTLRAIWKDLTPELRDVLDLMAYGAERVNALSMLPLENVHLIEGSNVAILDIPARLSKTGARHPSIIPKDLAERLLERATTLNSKTLNRGYKHDWTKITKLTKTKFNVRLTSHYLRKRFETAAERIPSDEMNPNHWVILMGSKPTVGHMPELYSLLTNRELIEEYETYLMPKLTLSCEQSIQPKPIKQITASLLKTIESLNLTIDTLNQQLSRLQTREPTPAT